MAKIVSIISLLIVMTSVKEAMSVARRYELPAQHPSGSNFYPFAAHLPQGRQVVFHNPIADQNLPCTSEGFFPHPNNCSQFYRCVDYLGIGQVFSRYLFHCPRYHVFIIGKDTCVPGKCSDLQGLSRPIPGISTPTQPPQNPQTGFNPTKPPPQNPQTGFNPTKPPQPQTYPTYPTAGPTSTTTYPTPISTTTTMMPTTRPQTASTYRPAFPGDGSGNQICSEGKYQQHRRYCNVYHPCGNDKLNYACETGSSFDFDRQMCRKDQDGSLCQGKEEMNINRLYSALFSPEDKTNQKPFISNLRNSNPQEVKPQLVQHFNTVPVQPQAVFNPNVSPLFFQNTLPLQYYPSNLFYQNPKRVSVF